MSISISGPADWSEQDPRVDPRWRTFRARFTPARTDDLKPQAAARIGEVFEWYPQWIIEDGPYEGQWACSPTENVMGWAWAPACDLTLDEHRSETE